MSPNEIILILGAGPRIGASVARHFARDGYQVVVASRKGTGIKTAEGYLSLEVDVAKPDSISALFSRVKNELEAYPSVIVYNAAARTVPPIQDSMFSMPAQSVVADLNVNTVGPFVAAQQAVGGWKLLPTGTKKTFIYTGNILNTTILPMPAPMTLAMGKSASAAWIGLADTLHSAHGIRFFYADERSEEGGIKGMAIDGDAHAEFYSKLANHESVPWHATFVKGRGYVHFK